MTSEQITMMPVQMAGKLIATGVRGAAPAIIGATALLAIATVYATCKVIKWGYVKKTAPKAGRNEAEKITKRGDISCFTMDTALYKEFEERSKKLDLRFAACVSKHSTNVIFNKKDAELANDLLKTVTLAREKEGLEPYVYKETNFEKSSVFSNIVKGTKFGLSKLGGAVLFLDAGLSKSMQNIGSSSAVLASHLKETEKAMVAKMEKDKVAVIDKDKAVTKIDEYLKEGQISVERFLIDLRPATKDEVTLIKSLVEHYKKEELKELKGLKRIKPKQKEIKSKASSRMEDYLVQRGIVVEVSENKKGLAYKIDDNHAERLRECVQELLEPQQNKEQEKKNQEQTENKKTHVNNDGRTFTITEEYRRPSDKEKELLNDMLKEFYKEELEQYEENPSLFPTFSSSEERTEAIAEASFKSFIGHLRKNRVEVDYDTEALSAEDMFFSLEIKTDVTQKFTKCAEEFLASRKSEQVEQVEQVELGKKPEGSGKNEQETHNNEELFNEGKLSVGASPTLLKLT